MLRRLLLPMLGSAWMFPAAAQPRPGAPLALPLSPANTTIGFSIGALGLFTLQGHFTRFAGDLLLDQARPEATRVAVLVDTTSVEAEGGASDTAREIDLLRTQDFPTLSFRSESVSVAPDGSATVLGQLTLAGITKPLQLVVRREQQSFLAAGIVERSSHGLFALRPILADRVRLAIAVHLPGQGPG